MPNPEELERIRQLNEMVDKKVSQSEDAQATTPSRFQGQTMIEITSDPLDARAIIQEVRKALRGENGRGANREISLAITKLQEAEYWLFESFANPQNQKENPK